MKLNLANGKTFYFQVNEKIGVIQNLSNGVDYLRNTFLSIFPTAVNGNSSENSINLGTS